MNKILIKNSYKELSIEEYRIISKILMSDLPNKDINIIKQLVTTDKNKIDSLPLSELMKLSSAISFLNESIVAEDIKKSYEFGGKKFSIVIHPNKITTAQFVDLQNIIKESGNIMDIVEKIVAVFLVPKGSEYNDGSYDMQDHISFILKNCPITVANDIAFFFYTLKVILLRASQEYLVQEGKTILKALKKKKDLTEKEKTTMKAIQASMDLVKRGVGSFSLTK